MYTRDVIPAMMTLTMWRGGWQEEEKKMRAYAVIPPMMLDDRQRKLRFYNKNGLVDDPKADHQQRQNVNVWTEHEKDIFKEKFLMHPKNFGFIASFLERKVRA